MNAGFKALVLDCELLQVALQMTTYVPTGDFTKGLGTGHVSLEPALLFSLKLDDDQYLQGAVKEWVPIGGDPSYEGCILLHQLSYNRVLWRFGPDVMLVGTVEYNGWTFQSGMYTDPLLGGMRKSDGDTYIALGPGGRLFFGDRFDLGIGSNFALTSQHFADQLFRTEFRIRF